LLVNIRETQLSKLQKAQNRAIRVILKYNRYIEAKHAASVAVYIHKMNYKNYIIIYIFSFLKF